MEVITKKRLVINQEGIKSYPDNPAVGVADPTTQILSAPDGDGFTFLTTAASFIPSLLDVILVQAFVPPVNVFSTQFTPESVLVQILPLRTTAASFVPSLLDVILYHVVEGPYAQIFDTQISAITRKR